MGGGGSQPSIPNVQTPSLSSLMGSATDASIENLPKLLEAFQKYGPQYAQSINDIYRQQTPELQQTLGNMTSLTNANLGFLQGAQSGQNNGIPQPLQLAFQQNLRGAQAARGMGDSPASAYSEATGLAGVGEQYRQNVTGESQAFMNSLPQFTPGANQSMSTLGLNPISPTDALSANLDLTGLDISNQWDQFAAQTQQWNNKQALQQSLFGGVGALYGGAIGAGLGGPMGAAVGAGVGAGFGKGVGTMF